MSGFEHFYTGGTGVKHEWADNGDGQYVIRSSQDIEAALDYNKAAYTHNDGYAPSRELRRVAHIPDIVNLQWLAEGFDYRDPNNAKELKRRLNSSEYLFLRTASGRI